MLILNFKNNVYALGIFFFNNLLFLKFNSNDLLNTYYLINHYFLNLITFVYFNRFFNRCGLNIIWRKFYYVFI